MDDVNFACTACGRCCHDLRLPLTMSEARDWLVRGGQVELLCEAIPWPTEPDAGNPQATYKRARSSPARSGTLPVRISIILTAVYAGPCPNLGEDMLCTIYEERPLVCRIYPAEINPFVSLMPESKACPPEAWLTTPLQRQGVIVDATIHALIQQARAAAESETALRMQLCRELGIGHAALANEGFVIHAPDRSALLAALEQCQAPPATHDEPAPWTFVSNRAHTIETLTSVGATSCAEPRSDTASFRYLGFFPRE